MTAQIHPKRVNMCDSAPISLFYKARFSKLLAVVLTSTMLTLSVYAQERLPVKRYASQPDWSQLQLNLPAEYNFTNDYAPVESSWMWENNAIHLDRFPNPNASAKIIVLHGLGENGRLMSLIAGGPLSLKGYETLAPDLQGFGLTNIAVDTKYSYENWIGMVDALIQAERLHDNRPIFLLGIGSGGMLAYHVAAINSDVKGVMVTAFLDQSNASIRAKLAQNKFLAHIGQPLVRAIGVSKLDKLPFTNAVALNRKKQVNSANIGKILAKDPLSSGATLPAGFLESYLEYIPDITPEKFTTCPILLIQPTQDNYASDKDNLLFLNRLTSVSATHVDLNNAGHIPVEASAIADLSRVVDTFVQQHRN